MFMLIWFQCDLSAQSTTSNNDRKKDGTILVDSISYQQLISSYKTAQVQLSDKTIELQLIQIQAKWLTMVMVLFSIIIAVLLIYVFKSRKAKHIIELQNKELNRKQEALTHTKTELQKTLKIAQDSSKSLRVYNQQLKSMQSQLIHAEKMSSLGQLTAGIVHEINNPVNFVKGGIELIDKNLQAVTDLLAKRNQALISGDLKQADEYFNKLVQELGFMQEFMPQILKDVMFGTSRISEIVNGLRIFSRQSESNSKFAKLEEIINSSLLILRNRYLSVAELKLNIDPKLEEIECFPGLLNQVFVNLISNAIDAIGEKGQIWIDVLELEEWVQIEIGDNGSGIKADHLPHIFEPFFTTKDVGKGTGIGLSICYSIISKHGGSIEVDSTSEKGTIFKVLLKKRIEKEKIKQQDKNVIEV